jgi:zinc D-Ala-D-Ala carboxypeptidase
VHLSQNFLLSEFEASETAARLDILNRVPHNLIPHLERLCQQILEPVRTRFGPVRITSGYRCIPLNRALRSKDTSHHVLGRAADIVVINGSRPLTVCDWIANAELPFDQCINENLGGQSWTHISVCEEGKPPKRELLTIDRQGTRQGLHEARP